MKRYFLILLVISSAGFGDIWVDWEQGDDNHPGIESLPKKHVMAAYDVVENDETVWIQDGHYDQAQETLQHVVLRSTTKSVTFRSVSGDRENVVLHGVSGQSYLLRIDIASGTPLIKFMDMTFDGTTDRNGNPLAAPVTNTYYGHNPGKVEFENCVLKGSGVGGQTVFPNGGSRFLLKNCHVTVQGFNGRGVILSDNSLDLDVLLDQCSFSVTGGGKSYAVYASLGTNRCRSIYIKDSDFNVRRSGIYIINGLEYVLVENCNIKSIPTDTGYGIGCGVDGPTNSNPLGTVIIKNNRVEYASSGGFHSIFTGAGVDYAEISGNYINGGTVNNYANIGIACKAGMGTHISNNISIGPCPIYFKASSNLKVHNNTFVGKEFAVMRWAEYSGNLAQNNHIVDNIFDGSESNYIIYISRQRGENNFMDYNCYHVGNSFAYVDGINVTTFTDWKAQRDSWVANDAFLWPQIDNNSFEADPQLGSDYRVKNEKLWNTGSPLLIGSDGTLLLRNDIGVTKFGDGYAILTDECIEPPYMDFNGDCKVDFADFSEFALEWMTCGLEDQSNCWE